MSRLQKKHAAYLPAPVLVTTKPPFPPGCLPIYKVNAYIFAFKSETINLPTQIHPLPMIFFVILNKYMYKM